MIVFAVEPWDEAREEIVEHWPDHYREAYGDDDFAFDFATYDILAVAGELLVVTARRDGVLVGYLLAFVRHDLRQSHVLWGAVDMYWLAPACRGPRVFTRMVAAAEEAMRSIGVQRIMMMERDDGTMLARIGYRRSEISYRKDLSP